MIAAESWILVNSCQFLLIVSYRVLGSSWYLIMYLMVKPRWIIRLRKQIKQHSASLNEETVLHDPEDLIILSESCFKTLTHLWGCAGLTLFSRLSLLAYNCFTVFLECLRFLLHWLIIMHHTNTLNLITSFNLTLSVLYHTLQRFCLLRVYNVAGLK